MNKYRELIASIEAGECRSILAFPPDSPSRWMARAAFRGSIDAAHGLHKSELPGWWWQVGTCSVSDDARVVPDFNCPVHGPRLLRELSEGDDWADMTDIAQTPPGNPARAWLLSILTALAILEERK